MKYIRDFYLKKKNQFFLEVKFSIYLNRCVFVMVNINISPVGLLLRQTLCNIKEKYKQKSIYTYYLYTYTLRTHITENLAQEIDIITLLYDI